MQQDKVTKVSDVGQNVWDEGGSGGKNVKPAYEPSYGERWKQTRPTKTIVFWMMAGVIVLTIIVGFSWGGWVTGGSVEKTTQDVITQRMASICVGQFNQDPQKEEKLIALQEANSFQRDDYVKDQGWATMPGEAEANSKVADLCAKAIFQNNR
jgi:hypothetical protein